MTPAHHFANLWERLAEKYAIHCATECRLVHRRGIDARTANRIALFGGKWERARDRYWDAMQRHWREAGQSYLREEPANASE